LNEYSEKYMLLYSEEGFMKGKKQEKLCRKKCHVTGIGCLKSCCSLCGLAYQTAQKVNLGTGRPATFGNSKAGHPV